MYEDCFEKLKLFLMYLSAVKGRSKDTVYGYYTDLKMLFRFLKIRRNLVPADTELENIRIDDITDDFLKSVSVSDLYEFLNYTRTEKNNSKRTTARKLSSLKGFFKYLYSQQVISRNITEDLAASSHANRSLPKYLTLNDCEKLINAVTGPQEIRDYCIIVLFMNCGMRLSELVGINMEDIKERQLLLRGKGNKERIIYLNDTCIDAIQKYKKYKEAEFQNKSYDRKPLFLGITGKRLGKRRIEDIVDKYLMRAGLKKMGMSTHKLRHTAATLMYQNDTDVRTLQAILGHSDLGTTQIYTHLSNKQVENAMSHNPVANIKKK